MGENKKYVRKPLKYGINWSLQDNPPPQAVELEIAVLGAIILEYNKCWDSVNYLLSVDVFYKEEHQKIFQAISSLSEEGVPVDLLTITNKLRSLGTLSDVGGPFYITQLCSGVVSSANIIHHAAIIYQKYILRELIKHSDYVMRSAYDDTTDVFTLQEVSVQLFGDIQYKVSLLKRETAASKVDGLIDSVVNGNLPSKSLVHKTGYSKFDQILGLAANEILMIAGPAGHGKTRFLISLMKLLLEQDDNIAIQWFAFEDPSDKIMRCFASSEILVTEKILSGKGGKKINEEEIKMFKEYMERFRKYDIEFVTDSKFIKQVNGMFQSFCRKRPNSLNICIIDNILLLEDSSNDRDDIIAKEIVKMRIATNGLIIPIHHFNDDQMDKDQKKAAYRPRIVHLKGRESYRRACTQIVLINKPGAYPDLVAEYRGLEDIFKHLFIIEVAKNRDGEANEDNATLIHYWCSLDFLRWKEIQ